MEIFHFAQGIRRKKKGGKFLALCFPFRPSVRPVIQMAQSPPLGPTRSARVGVLAYDAGGAPWCSPDVPYSGCADLLTAATEASSQRHLDGLLRDIKADLLILALQRVTALEPAAVVRLIKTARRHSFGLVGSIFASEFARDRPTAATLAKTGTDLGIVVLRRASARLREVALTEASYSACGDSLLTSGVLSTWIEADDGWRLGVENATGPAQCIERVLARARRRHEPSFVVGPLSERRGLSVSVVYDRGQSVQNEDKLLVRRPEGGHDKHGTSVYQYREYGVTWEPSPSVWMRHFRERAGGDEEFEAEGERESDEDEDESSDAEEEGEYRKEGDALRQSREALANAQALVGAFGGNRTSPARAAAPTGDEGLE